MRHPIISVATTWTTVVAVVTSALWLAVIEEQIDSRATERVRSVGMRVVAQRPGTREPLAATATDAAADTSTTGERAAAPRVFALTR